MTFEPLKAEEIPVVRALQRSDYEAAFVEPRMIGVAGLVFEKGDHVVYLVHCRENSWYTAGWWLILRAPGAEPEQRMAKSKQKGYRMALDWLAERTAGRTASTPEAAPSHDSKKGA